MAEKVRQIDGQSLIEDGNSWLSPLLYFPRRCRRFMLVPSSPSLFWCMNETWERKDKPLLIFWKNMNNKRYLLYVGNTMCIYTGDFFLLVIHILKILPRITYLHHTCGHVTTIIYFVQTWVFLPTCVRWNWRKTDIFMGSPWLVGNSTNFTSRHHVFM